MMLWSCGVNEGAPRKVIFWTRRYSDCTTSAKANWREPRCSTSILRQWPNSWKRRSTRPKTLFDHVTLSSSGGIQNAAVDRRSRNQQLFDYLRIPSHSRTQDCEPIQHVHV